MWKSFAVAKLNSNSLVNICDWTVVLYGQSLLHAQAISLEKFCGYKTKL